MVEKTELTTLFFTLNMVVTNITLPWNKHVFVYIVLVK